MAKDLERFLQQAAQRLAEKVNQADQRSTGTPNRPAQARNVRQAERARLEPEILEAEIVDEDLAGPDPISDLDTRHLDPVVAKRKRAPTSVDTADERFAAQVEQVTENDVSHLRKASAALERKEHEGRKAGPAEHLALIKMLRSPETLRSAFLASEIFRRKFD